MPYETPEAKARKKIEEQLRAAGWAVQDYQRLNLRARLREMPPLIAASLYRCQQEDHLPRFRRRSGVADQAVSHRAGIAHRRDGRHDRHRHRHQALECLLFMRDVKSQDYFEQMKGRGRRAKNWRKRLASRFTTPICAIGGEIR